MYIIDNNFIKHDIIFFDKSLILKSQNCDIIAN